VRIRSGTPQPIIVRNPNMSWSVALLPGFGTYSFQIKDPQQFVTQIVGAQGMYSTSDIEGRLRSMLLSKLSDLTDGRGMQIECSE
jgi:membrane protease subunit (stomatin/prohibitin family)